MNKYFKLAAVGLASITILAACGSEGASTSSEGGMMFAR